MGILRYILVGIILCFPLSANAAIYWVDSSGGAVNWADCQNATDPGEGHRCTLAQANAGITAGNTAYLKAGTYNTQIAPANSGNAENRIIYQAYNNEEVKITNTGEFGNGIYIDGKDYIKIDGIIFHDLYRWGNIRNGADHVELVNCIFYDTDGVATGGGLYVWGQCTGGSPYTCPTTHNWIHRNTFYNMGSISAECDDINAPMYLGSANTGNNDSNNQTIEDNVFYGGGHHLLETYTKYNVIRNNKFHNEGWITDPGTCTWGASPRNSKYGNRCIQIYDGHDAGNLYNVIEGNRLGHAAFASDGGMDGNLVITSQGNIVRFNLSFNSETMGLYLKQGGDSNSSNNRIYNNTVYNSGQNSRTYPNEWTGSGELDWRRGLYIANGTLSTGNVIKNNIIYNSFTADITCDATCQSNNTLSDNLTTDPSFVNPDVTDPTSLTLPNLTLQNGSGAIGTGTYLTQANGAGTNSSVLVVDDALYFQDGSWGSDLARYYGTMVPDKIAIGTVTNIVEIEAVDYANNRIFLKHAMTWADNASVWLYSKSDGMRVLNTSQDIGSHPYQIPVTYAPWVH
jgi:hypothetical protein